MTAQHQPQRTDQGTEAQAKFSDLEHSLGRAVGTPAEAHALIRMVLERMAAMEQRRVYVTTYPACNSGA